MSSKRIIPCLDVRNGMLTKGIKFEGNVDLGDPVTAAKLYCEQGADELVFYDITASAEGRGIFLDVVQRVMPVVTIPFCVGGGLATLDDVRAVLEVGANKASINSGAVSNPELIDQAVAAFGSAAVALGMDVKRVPVTERIPSGYEIVIQGGRRFMGLDAVQWAKECQERGAGEICLNSIDGDGTREGYDIPITRMVSEAVTIPVIASGGAGKPEDLYAAFTEGKASAALVASIVHYGDYTIGDLKQFLREKGLSGV